MKKLLLLKLAIAASLVLWAVGQTPTELVFTVDFSGASTERDRDAALLAIATENKRRAALETPLPALPIGTPGEIKSSLKTTLDFEVTRWFNSYIEQAGEAVATNQDVKELWLNATDAQRAAAIIALGG